MARIAVGGFQHETNTFAPLKATLADFEQADAWPGLTVGHALLSAVKGINLPAAGFIDEARSLGHEVVPLLWCSAQPSGFVMRDAFETITQRLLTELSTRELARCGLSRSARCDGAPSTSTTPMVRC